MTAFFKNKAIGQVDKILLNGKTLTRQDILELLKLSKDKK